MWSKEFSTSIEMTCDFCLSPYLCALLYLLTCGCWTLFLRLERLPTITKNRSLNKCIHKYIITKGKDQMCL